MNFGPEFRQWIRVICSEISSACLHSGYVTSFFEISRGARQGDPLSSLLYTLVAEVLGATIRNCKDIRGVRLPGSPEESKIGQYADDGDLTWLMIRLSLRHSKSFVYMREVQGPS